MTNMRKAISRWAFLGALLVAGGAHAAAIQITIDTTGFNGTNALLAFDLIDGGPPANSVAISGFSGGTLGAAYLFGDVTGSLLGIVTLGDTTLFNEYLQAITLGNSISFTFSASENAPDPGSGPDGFSFFVLDDVSGLPLFPTDDPTGADALFLYSIGNPNPLETFSDAVAVQVVPEPGALALAMVGILAFGFSSSARSYLIRRNPA